MLASLFRSNRPAVLVIVPVIVLVVFLPSLWRMTPSSGEAMPLYMLVCAPAGSLPWWPGLLTLVCTSLCAVQLALLANSAELFEQRGHLPALLFPLLLGAFTGGPVLEPALLGMPFVLAAMVRTWSIANSGRVLSALFDAGVLIGIASLFHLPYAFLVVVAWASVSVIRPFQWREYALPLLGTILPLYLAWSFLRLTGQGPWDPLATVIGTSSPGDRDLRWLPALRWPLYLVLGVLAAFASVIFGTGYQRGVMREKNLRASFMAFFFATGVLAACLYRLEGSYPAVMLVAPFAVFASHALLSKRRTWLSESAVLILLGAASWAQWA